MDAFHVGAAGDQPDDQMFEAITAHLTDLDTSPIDPPAEQTEADEPAEPPAAPETPAPAPTTDYDRQRPPAPAPEPAPQLAPSPAAQSAPTATAAPRRPRPQAPPAPDYWGRHGLVAVYWIAILTGAIGQVIFFGSLFDLGIGGYIAAAIIATTAETVMVSAGDTALHLRSRGRRRPQWVPFLLISVIAATAASGMNLGHWWGENISMAVLFGGIAFLGYLLHVVHGFGEGTEYLAEKAKYDAAVAELKAAERAEIEQANREQQRQRRAAELAAATTKPTPAPAKTSKPDKPKSRGKRKFDREVAHRELGEEFWTLGPAEINRRMADAGYEPVNPTTIRRWRKKD